MASNRILAWDLPTRAFHWLLTAVFVAATAIALGVDDDSRFFQVHMLLGLIAGFLVVLRLVWGVVGSRYARLGSFLFGPGALVAYLRGALRGNVERYVGHNPGSAYALFAMLFLILGLGLTGVLMPTWKALEEVHEVLAYLMLTAVVAHLVGLVWHTSRHHENISRSMVDGKKLGEPSQAIGSSHVAAGVVFVALTAGWAYLVFDGYDARAGRVTLLGQTVQLGEREEHERRAGREGRRRGERRHGGDHHDHDDDDD